jgi:hypothetical protein
VHWDQHADFGLLALSVVVLLGAQGRSGEGLDAVMLCQRLQGSFDSAGLRFAYPASLRMTISWMAIECAM